MYARRTVRRARDRLIARKFLSPLIHRATVTFAKQNITDVFKVRDSLVEPRRHFDEREEEGERESL